MIDRRSLIKSGALAGAAAAVAGRSNADARVAAASVPAFELEEATVTDLQKRMTSGADSARTLAEKYIARIEAVDRQGPTLRSVLEINPDALAIAERLDAERKAGKVRGPLHGIPVLIKDNIGTADKMQTTAGSLALVGRDPRRRRPHRPAAARRGSRHPRQDEPLGVGELPVDAFPERLERARRPVPQSLRARPGSRPARAPARAPRRPRISAR